MHMRDVRIDENVTGCAIKLVFLAMKTKNQFLRDAQNLL